MSKNIKNALLGEDELEQVSGGKESTAKHIIKTSNIQQIICKYCKQPFFADINKKQVTCTHCRKRNTLDG
ncbi:MAG: hypothetical protein E7305_06110 [Butyrivibrio sp.]|jgi:DNA-directed RNA polymerase subunit RPC12/RpoP|nr:hypothetical protein [Butyrivibrio sp.]